MSDFDFPIQSAPAAAMPFEPLTGNSRRSDMTVRYLSFSANFHSDINDNKSKWFYLQQVTGKSAADKWLGKENSSHAHSNFTSRAKPTPCTPEHQVKPIRVIKPGSTRDDLPRWPSYSPGRTHQHPSVPWCSALPCAGPPVSLSLGKHRS